MNTTTIPAGFRIDAKGRLIPESTIKPLDLIRDALVQQLVNQAKPLRAQLVDYRERAFAEIDALVDLAAQEYNATLGGEKGNVTLYSFDGRYKVIRARAEKISFDERLQAAKALIDECLRDWSQGARPEIATLVQDAFKVDQAGNIRTGTVLGLRRIQIADERWQNAMLAIGDAVQVVDSKSYLRLYERDAKGDYQPISLDIAAVKS
jgi:hypothetical protein